MKSGTEIKKDHCPTEDSGQFSLGTDCQSFVLGAESGTEAARSCLINCLIYPLTLSTDRSFAMTSASFVLCSLKLNVVLFAASYRAWISVLVCAIVISPFNL